MNRLRTRLLLSYVLIIVVTLAVIGGTLLLVLRSQPLPVAGAYQRLGDTVRGLAARFEAQGSQLGLLTPAQIEGALSQVADSTGLRVLIVEIRDEQPYVVFDSLRRFVPGDPVPGYKIDSLRSRGNLLHGTFEDPGDAGWLFVGGQRLIERVKAAQGEPSRLALFATPAPQTGLSALFDWFGDNLLTPLLRAGLVGLVVAVALSALIARSVARPLQQMAQAAEAVATGDYDQRVPEAGPDEVRTVAGAFNRMTRQVKASQQAQRDFVANVSHDLRTPLTSIQGFSQAILDGTAAPPDGARRAAAVIYDEAARLSRMVDELLDLARIDTGQWRMERQVINPAAILRAVGEKLALRAQQAGVALRVQVPDLPDAIGDGDRLAQVFTNLVDNALKHTPPGGTVTLIGARQDDGLELAVADNGEGIPPEDLSRVFERFYQVDKSRQRDARRTGAGLGLAISRQIVEAHGGTIRVESVLGVGTRFAVWLPLPRPTDTTVARRKW